MNEELKMKEFNKSIKLEHVAYDIRGPVLKKLCMRAMEKILRLNTVTQLSLLTAPVIHDLIMNAIFRF